LNTDLNNSAKCYLGMIDNKPVAFCAVAQLPYHKGVKRIHRLVVLPDYQGVGIGTEILTEIAKINKKKNNDVMITTSTPALLFALKKHNDWALARYGRTSGISSLSSYKFMSDKEKQCLANTLSNNRITYSYWYIGGREA